MASEIASKLVHDIVSTADLFLRESTRLFRPLGLTAAQFNVLNLLGAPDAERGLSQRELADMLVLKRGNRLSITPVEAKHWKAIVGK